MTTKDLMNKSKIFSVLLVFAALVVSTGCQKWHHETAGVKKGEQPAYTVEVDRSKAE